MFVLQKLNIVNIQNSCINMYGVAYSHWSLLNLTKQLFNFNQYYEFAV